MKYNILIKSIRLLLGMTLDQLGDELDISSSYLCELEQNRKPINLDRLSSYAKLLDLRLSVIIHINEHIELGLPLVVFGGDKSNIDKCNAIITICDNLKNIEHSKNLIKQNNN
jgi:transcriptional regulator with XRE-family HTH domain